MSISYSFTVTTSMPAEEVFDYVADLRNLATWDPETTMVEQTSEGEPTGVGATFRLRIERWLVPDTTLDYEVVEFERPRRVVARATGEGVDGVDTFTVSPTGDGGSAVVYATEIELTGVAKLTKPIAGAAVKRSGEKTRAGLERALNAA